jgi:hypothetical protein
MDGWSIKVTTAEIAEVAQHSRICDRIVKQLANRLDCLESGSHPLSDSTITLYRQNIKK